MNGLDTETSLAVTSYQTKEHAATECPHITLVSFFNHSCTQTLCILPPGHPRLSQYTEVGCLGYSSYPAAQLQVCDSSLIEPQTYATHTQAQKENFEPDAKCKHLTAKTAVHVPNAEGLNTTVF